MWMPLFGTQEPNQAHAEGVRWMSNRGRSRDKRSPRWGDAASFSVLSNRNVKPSWCFMPVLYIGHGFNIWWCLWQSGSSLPLSLAGCSAFTKWPWRSSPNVWRKNNPLRQQLQWMRNVLWHQAGTRDESWLRKEITSYCMTSWLLGATRCSLRDSHPPRLKTPTEEWRVGGR